MKEMKPPISKVIPISSLFVFLILMCYILSLSIYKLLLLIKKSSPAGLEKSWLRILDYFLLFIYSLTMTNTNYKDIQFFFIYLINNTVNPNLQRITVLKFSLKPFP